MKTSTRALGTGFALSSAMLLASGGALAAADIANTKHNLSSGSTATIHVTNDGITVPGDGTAAICVFCHTPHGSDTSAAVPLWNKALPASTSFTTYDALGTTTLDGKVAKVGSVSIACLSCHDGVSALDNIINAPGSGGYDATGGGPNGLAWTWSGLPVGTDKMPAGITQIGVDLRNDHPVGVQYAGGGYDWGDPTGKTPNDPGFVAPTWNATTSRMYAGGLPLYKRVAGHFATGSGITTDQATVECASCHDPHEKDNPTFLRVANTGSSLCLACHNK